MSRKRALSAEDKRLWWHVTRQVKPLMHDAEAVEAEQPAPAPASPALAPAPAVPKIVKKPATPRDILDLKLKRKVTRGTQDIEARLDLHGYRQEEAHRLLLQFLRQSQALQRRVVIVITGKGQPQHLQPHPHHEKDWHWNPYVERGVLRRLVPQWLKLPEFHAYVVGFETAGRGHGGDGAIYVHIRRMRE